MIAMASAARWRRHRVSALLIVLLILLIVAVRQCEARSSFPGQAAANFYTPIGYEVLEPWGNANISRSYSWSLLQPINHDGAFVSGRLPRVE